MATLFGRKHNEVCCCGGNCTTGCCIPVDHSNPLYEPTGTPKNVPFTISAPSCPELDGYTGELICGGTAPAILGPCGVCVSCRAEADFLLGGLRWLETFACVPDSCSIRLCLGLSCLDNTVSDESQEVCCRKFRLQIGSSTPLLNGSPATVGLCDNFIEVAPLSCVCADDPADMPAVVFPLIMPFDCQTFYSGHCAGLTTCCDQFSSCDLTDAVVII